MNNAQRFCLEQEKHKSILLGAKQPGCVVSVHSDMGLPPVFMSVYYFSHLRTITSQCGIYLLIIIRVPVESFRR